MSYSWTGGFSFGNCDVHAELSGDGTATLQIGERDPIHTPVTRRRYRELIRSLATNHFASIEVKRSRGGYLHDIGEYKIILSDGLRKTAFLVDEKHYVDQPERLASILATVYSFEQEFGEPLDFGPLGVAGSSDPSEIITAVMVVLTGLALGIGSPRQASKTRKICGSTSGSDGPATAGR